MLKHSLAAIQLINFGYFRDSLHSVMMVLDNNLLQVKSHREKFRQEKCLLLVDRCAYTVVG
jgi:hypothetical protein